MSGIPSNTEGDLIKNRNEYMETLKLQEQNNDMNLQANKNYLLTGQLPPSAQMLDTRTNSEKLADSELLKKSIAEQLRPIAEPTFAYQIVNEVLRDPLNIDNSLFRFLAQNTKLLVEQVKGKYYFGIAGDKNDLQVIVEIIKDLYTNTRSSLQNVKTYVSSNITQSGQTMGLDYENMDRLINEVRRITRGLSHHDLQREDQNLNRLVNSFEALQHLLLTSAEMKYLLDNFNDFPENYKHDINRYIESLTQLPKTNQILTLVKYLDRYAKSHEDNLFNETINRIFQIINPLFSDRAYELHFGPHIKEEIRRVYEHEEENMERNLNQIRREKQATGEQLRRAGVQPVFVENWPDNNLNNEYRPIISNEHPEDELEENFINNQLIANGQNSINEQLSGNEQEKEYVKNLITRYFDLLNNSNDLSVEEKKEIIDNINFLGQRLTQLKQQPSQGRGLSKKSKIISKINLLKNTINSMRGYGLTEDIEKTNKYIRNYKTKLSEFNDKIDEQRELQIKSYKKEIEKLEKLLEEEQRKVKHKGIPRKPRTQKKADYYLDIYNSLKVKMDREDKELFKELYDANKWSRLEEFIEYLFEEYDTGMDNTVAQKRKDAKGLRERLKELEELRERVENMAVERASGGKSYKHLNNKIIRIEDEIEEINSKLGGEYAEHVEEPKYNKRELKQELNRLIKQQEDNIREGKGYNQRIHSRIAQIEKELGVRGKGIRGRGIKGCGICKFTEFGNSEINESNLDKNIFSMRRKTKSNYMDIPSKRISSPFKKIIKTIVGGGMPQFDEINSLDKEEQEYLYKITKKSKLIDRISVPTPNKEEDEKDINQFEIMKGEILAGNDSKKMVKNFKILLLKLSRKNLLPKNQVKDLMETLLELGY